MSSYTAIVMLLNGYNGLNSEYLALLTLTLRHVKVMWGQYAKIQFPSS